MLTITERARAYIAKMPPAIQGSSGDQATFKVACVLVKGFALDEGTALKLLMEWNDSNAVPPWRESELRQKVRSAAQLTGPVGYLLDEAAPYTSVCSTAGPSEAERKAMQRRGWPTFTYPSPHDLQRIAALRKLTVAAVDLCARSGFIRMAEVDGHYCFIIREGRFAQARRMDGHLFRFRDGNTSKTKNLFGSEGAFLGARWLGGPGVGVLLVEGCIGLVECAAALLLADRADWTVIAATSAGSRFARAPQLLEQLRGRRVRIIPDNDPAGFDAAGSWLSDLTDAGAFADCVPIPPGSKDLGNVIADPALLQNFTPLLFP